MNFAHTSLDNITLEKDPQLQSKWQKTTHSRFLAHLPKLESGIVLTDLLISYQKIRRLSSLKKIF